MAIYKDVEPFEVFAYQGGSDDFDDGVNFVLEKLDELPVADVVEVKRGEWQREIDDFDWEYIKCSICGEELYPPDNDDTFDVLPKYCPNCGAKMDGKEQNVV